MCPNCGDLKLALVSSRASGAMRPALSTGHARFCDVYSRQKAKGKEYPNAAPNAAPNAQLITK